MAKETMRLPLHWQIAVALVLGVAAGFTLGEAAGYFEFLGVIFMRALPMIMAPLVFSSLVVGVSSVGGLSKLGWSSSRSWPTPLVSAPCSRRPTEGERTALV
ncbi:MAG: cation:dicarboxylase symporter family transporter [bacterium]|nr:cation:dicarboxylase symporter family transporter [bacterium]